MRLPRSLADFDTGLSQVGGAVPAVELMQIGPQATAVLLPNVTEIRQRSRADLPSVVSAAGVAALSGLGAQWSTSYYLASAYGVGGDNPADPYYLTALQERRSIMAMFDGISAFQVRFAIDGCCTTGRNVPPQRPRTRVFSPRRR